MSLGSSDTYDVVMTVDDSDAARAVRASLRGVQELDYMWKIEYADQQKAMAAQTKATGEVGKSAHDATISGLAMTAAFMGIGAAYKLISEFKDILGEVRKNADETAKHMFQVRDSMRDVMSVQGMTGKESGEVIKQHIELMKVSGMTTREAHDFSAEFLGEAEAYKDRMKPEEYAKLQQDTARFAMVEGGETGMHAKLAGRLLSVSGPGTTAGQIEAQQAEIYRILNLGSGRTAGVGTAYTEAAASLVAPEGQAGGMVGDMRTLAVMAMSASRLSAESGVDTSLANFAQAMTGNVRSRGGQWQRFIKDELGLREGTKTEEAMGPVFDAMAKAEGEGRDLMTFLDEKGLTNKTVAKTVVGMYRQRTQMAEQLKKDRPLETEASAAATIEEAYATRPELQQRQADAQLEAAKLERGQQGEMARRFRTLAEAELTKDRRIGPDAIGKNVTDDMLLRNIYGGDYDKAMIDQRAAEIAQKTLGVKFRRSRVLPSWLGGSGEEGQTDEAYAYASSNQFEQDVRDTADSRIDPTNRMRLGWDAKMHSEREIKEHFAEIARNTRQVAQDTQRKPISNLQKTKTAK